MLHSRGGLALFFCLKWFLNGGASLIAKTSEIGQHILADSRCTYLGHGMYHPVSHPTVGVAVVGTTKTMYLLLSD